MKSKKFLSKSKRIVISAMAAVCAFSSVTAINTGALDYSNDKTSVTVNSSETTNGYSLKLSGVTGSSVGSNWQVTNGGPVLLSSRNSVLYVKTNGSQAIYDGNKSDKYTTATYQLRTISTSSLSGYSRTAKIEASGYSSCIRKSVGTNGTVFINAYY